MLTNEERGYYERRIKALEDLANEIAKASEVFAKAVSEISRAASEFAKASEVFSEARVKSTERAPQPGVEVVFVKPPPKTQAKPAPANLPAGEFVLAEVTAAVYNRIQKYGDAARATDKQYNLWRGKIKDVVGLDGGRLVTALLAEIPLDEMTKTWRPSMSACAAWLDWLLSGHTIKPESEIGLHALLDLAEREQASRGDAPPWD